MEPAAARNDRRERRSRAHMGRRLAQSVAASEAGRHYNRRFTSGNDYQRRPGSVPGPRHREHRAVTTTGITRRDFVKTAGAAVGTLALPTLQTQTPATTKRRYAIVGTGVRAVGMWGQSVAKQLGDSVEFVGLCDINPLRLEAAKRAIGVNCPTFTNLDAMLDQAKPELL